MNNESETVAVLARKAEREKRAREAAEKQLEDYSLQVYQSQVSLKESLAQSKKREVELQFLADLSAHSVAELTVEQLLRFLVSLSCDFLPAHSGVIIQSNGNSQHFNYAKQTWQQVADLNTEPLPALGDSLTESWLVLPLDEANPPLYQHSTGWALYMDFELPGGARGAVGIFLSTDYLDEESLYVMETGRRHVLGGLKRRVNEHQILTRSEQLQKTLDELEVAQQQLMQSEKMASLGQLSAGIAHEINNPLSYVKSNLESLQDYLQTIWQWRMQLIEHLESQTLEATQFRRYDDSADLSFVQEDAQEIMSSVLGGLARVREIINDLKAFSHAGTSELGPISLHECVESALKIAWNSLKYDYVVKQEIARDLPMVQGNVGQLQQVFVNLFVNAGQAMEPSDSLTISAKQQRESVRVVVADTGCGMSEDTLKKLFTPFFTTKPVGVGTGLGLSVSYGILNRHKAKVEVLSTLGEGTRFIIDFPITVTA